MLWKLVIECCFLEVAVINLLKRIEDNLPQYKHRLLLQFEDAKCTYLLACRDSPSCTAWNGVGVACYRMGTLPEAEDALCEANILNNRDPEVWAYLTLVCLQTGRSFEAEQSYKYALKVFH